MRTPLCILSDLNLLVFADSRFPENEELRSILTVDVSEDCNAVVRAVYILKSR